MVALRKRTRALKPQIVDDSASESENDDVCCEECGSGHSPARLLLCDGCDRGYHLFCLRPILVNVPKGTWFGPCCSKQKKPKCKFMDFPNFFFTNSVQIHFIINSFWVFNLSCLISLVVILNWVYWILLKHKFDYCSFLWYCSFPSHSDQNH